MTCRAMVWAVNGNLYDDGWNLNVYSVENPNEWNAGNQFCSRNSSLSSTLSWCGSFLEDISFPSTNVLSDSFYLCAKRDILFV